MRCMAAVLSVFLLASCLGRTPDSDFYGLRTVAPVQALSMRRLSVAVNRAVIPGYLEKPQIVMLDNTGGVELNINEYQRWGEPLSSSVQRITADDLSLLLPNALIKPQNFTPQTYQYYLTIEVNRMDGIWNKEAVLDVWWTISDPYNKVLKRQKENLSAPLGKGYDDYVQTQSRLLAELSARIAAALLQLR